jgi:hypothetical protein
LSLRLFGTARSPADPKFHRFGLFLCFSLRLANSSVRHARDENPNRPERSEVEGSPRRHCSVPNQPAQARAANSATAAGISADVVTLTK